jgi:hypothetical protein
MVAIMGQPVRVSTPGTVLPATRHSKLPAPREPGRALAGQTSVPSGVMLTGTGDPHDAPGGTPMFEHYYAALFKQLQGDLAPSAAPDAGQAKAPADHPIAAGPNGSSEWDPCPCWQWGVCRADRHGCAAMCKELFPELDRELDAWEAAHGWLYS